MRNSSQKLAKADVSVPSSQQGKSNKILETQMRMIQDTLMQNKRMDTSRETNRKDKNDTKKKIEENNNQKGSDPEQYQEPAARHSSGT